MHDNGHNNSYKRWLIAWSLAILCHLLIIGWIAWMNRPDPLIHVGRTVPMPNQTVDLMPAQGLEPAVFFTGSPASLKPESALIYRIQEDNSRELIGSAHPHPDKSFCLQFDAVSEPGTYEIVVLDGKSSVHPDFDGEYEGQFPSGNGKVGGQFVMQFKIAQSKQIMTATVFTPDKPLVNEEPAAKMEPQHESQPEKPVPVSKPTPVKSHQKPTPPTENKPTSPLVEENSAPVATGEPTTEEPSPVRLKPEDLRITPYNFAPELIHDANKIAQINFELKDTNQTIRDHSLAKQRYEAAYNPDGPVVGIGERGNSVEHNKNVAEYLALMHKEIHPLWAYGYLLRLDTIYRNPGSQLNRSDLEAVLEITLDHTGQVSDVRVVRSSGITDYDSEAIHVAWNSSPGIQPPDEMRSNNGKTYIHWTFWRDQRQCGVFGVKVFRVDKNYRNSLEFNLKEVQMMEKKLGLTPSVIPNLPSNSSKKNSQSSQKPEETQENTPLPDLPVKINPLED